MRPTDYHFTRYLESKKSIDDASLNRMVWQRMADSIPRGSRDKPIEVFEIGAGIGTMLTRMIEWNLFDHAIYTAIDNQKINIGKARVYLQTWAKQNDFQVEVSNHSLILAGNGKEVSVSILNADLFAYIAAHPAQNIDLLVANAFLDLVPLPDTLELIFSGWRQSYLFYFSINYDGLTILEPVIDPEFDQLVLDLYHETMNERYLDGIRFGDYQTGRHLLSDIPKRGGSILATGSSDWIVFPHSGGYSNDGAYFLHFIIHTIDNALQNHPLLDKEIFSHWINRRHQQVEEGELIYIAHQVDILGKAQPNSDPV